MTSDVVRTLYSAWEKALMIGSSWVLRLASIVAPPSELSIFALISECLQADMAMSGSGRGIWCLFTDIHLGL